MSIEEPHSKNPDEPASELIREMYARFGLAYYHSEVLHRGLCILSALSDQPEKELVTRLRIEECLAHAFSLTFGIIITELKEKIPAELSTELDEACKKRNFLAHHFWYERNHLMFRTADVEHLISELGEYSDLFCLLNEQISKLTSRYNQRIGLTDQVLEESFNRIMSGNVRPPFPDSKIARDREKRLSKKQCLLRVWEFALPEGGKPLVFEMQDGAFWQLCDIGLGWTEFENIEPHWIEQPIIKPYLPAEILPRPKNIKPWEYEFPLKDSAILWIKPGRKPQTFSWGIRTNK